MLDPYENLMALSKVLAKCWIDPEFEAVFRAHPEEVLRRHGYPLGQDVKVILHTCTEREYHLGLPPRPPLEQFTPNRLKVIAEAGLDPETDAPLFCEICNLCAPASIARTLA